MKNARILILLALATIVSKNSLADNEPDYYCKITSISSAAPNKGYLNLLEGHYVGEAFTVERKTGLMTGVIKNSFITKPEVIDMGLAGNSYKVITVLKANEGLGPGSNIHVLNINEFEKTDEKSFVYLNNDEVYFGVCKHAV